MSYNNEMFRYAEMFNVHLLPNASELTRCNILDELISRDNYCKTRLQGDRLLNVRAHPCPLEYTELPDDAEDMLYAVTTAVFYNGLSDALLILLLAV